MPGNFLPQDQGGLNNLQSQLLMVLNYLQSQLGQQSLSNFIDHPQRFINMDNLPMQGQFHFPKLIGDSNYSHQEEQRISHAGSQQHDKHKNEHDSKNRRDRDDKSHRNDKEFKGDKEDKIKGGCHRNDRGNKGDIKHKSYTFEKSKRMDSSRDRKYDRRSRSASRDREKRDGLKGNCDNNFNRGRGGGDKVSTRDNSNKGGSRHPRGRNYEK